MYGEAPQYYPHQHQQHQQQQEYFEQPERQTQQSFYQPQQQQYKHQSQVGQRHQERHQESLREQPGPSPHSQVDTVDKKTGPAVSSEEPKDQQETDSGAQEQQEDETVDPKLRDFTLIISKLLFQFSQL